MENPQPMAVVQPIEQLLEHPPRRIFLPTTQRNISPLQALADQPAISTMFAFWQGDILFSRA